MQRKHKILFFDHDARLTGSTISMLYMIRAYISAGYQISIFTRKKGEFLELLKQYDITIYQYSDNPLLGIYLSTHFSDEGSIFTKKGIFTIAKDALRFFVGIFSSFKVLTKDRPDLVYFNEYNVIHCGLVAKLFNIPVITHVRSRFLHGGFGFRRKLLQKMIVSFSSRVFPISIIEAEQLNTNNSKVIVLPEFLDESDFIKSEINKPASVIMLGGIDYMKGSLDYLKAAELILNKRDDIKFYLAGALVKRLLDNKENLYLQECYNIYNKLLTNSNFQYLGIISNVPEILKSKKILVSPSLLSHFARPIIEAWANNAAVIAANSMHTKTYVEDGKNALVYEPNNYNALAQKIEDLIDNNNIYEKLTKEGYLTARNVYACENYKVLLEETKKVLDGK